MPRVSYIPVPPRKQLHDLFSHYCKSRKLNSADLAEKRKITPDALRKQINRPDKAWRLEEIQDYCRLLDVQSLTLVITKGAVTVSE